LSKVAEKEKLVYYRLNPGMPLTPEQEERLKKLDELPDDQIDLSDIPEWTEEMFKNAKRGAFYRPIKEAVSIRVDADVLAWLKKDGPGYQSRINAMLRERMLADLGAAHGRNVVAGSVTGEAIGTVEENRLPK
jgi:uncharacterized protein (DUF4415 family)